MPGVKTNEVAGTRAVLRHYRMSAYKVREVLDLVRGQDVDRAEQTLRATPRQAARVVEKVLASAVANARNNDLLDPDELYVSACFADEGTTLKRWRPRARGRATRIRKRSCHITVIVTRLPEDRLERRRARQSDVAGAMRSRRVAASRRGRGRGAAEELPEDASAEDASAEDVAAEDVDVNDEDVTGEDVTDEDVTDDEVTDEVEVEAGTDLEGDAVDGDAEGKDRPAVVEAADEPAVADEPHAEVEAEESAGQVEEPAPKPRRARARKATKKQASSPDAGGAGDGADEEKD